MDHWLNIKVILLYQEWNVLRVYGWAQEDERVCMSDFKKALCLTNERNGVGPDYSVPFMLLAQHYAALLVMYPCVFSPSLPSFLCVCKRMWLAACVGLVPVWHIWMCLARPKFLNETNPQPLHNPPLLCNDCCSSLHSPCPTPRLLPVFSWPTRWCQNIHISQVFYSIMLKFKQKF